MLPYKNLKSFCGENSQLSFEYLANKVFVGYKIQNISVKLKAVENYS